MRKSIILVAAASACAAGFGYPQIRDAVRDLADTARPSAPAAIRSEAPPVALAQPQSNGSETSRVFSSNQPLLSTPAPSDTTMPVSPKSTSTQTLAQLPTPSVANPGTTPDQPVRRLSSSRPADEDARRELVRDLQRELKRVGCYEGEINGNWAPAAKRAMAAFTERVNATLPLDEPDYILLTLVQGHSVQACGKGCPSGQAMNNSGRCVPSAIIARTGRPVPDKSASIQDDPPSSKVRAEPRRNEKRVGADRVASPSWASVVTVAPQAKSPASVNEPRIANSTPATRDPLPGRMAIGAPIATPLPVPTEQDRLKAELAKRKAELAQAEAQRFTAADLERKARLADIQAKKAAKTSASNPTDTRSRLAAEPNRSSSKPPTVIAAARIEAGQSPPPLPPITAPAAPPVSLPRVISEKQAKQFDRRQLSRMQPAPRGQIRGYPGQVVILMPSPAPAPRYGYVPQPSRWTRNVFSEVGRR